jgi:curved DNA-binding protein CbpA
MERAQRQGRGEASSATDGGTGVDDADEIDPYDVLGLQPGADAAEIKSAFRKGALRWHPDKHADACEDERADAERMFQVLNLAHSVLSDPVKRRQYDAGGRVRDIIK